MVTVRYPGMVRRPASRSAGALTKRVDRPLTGRQLKGPRTAAWAAGAGRSSTGASTAGRSTAADTGPKERRRRGLPIRKGSAGAGPYVSGTPSVVRRLAWLGDHARVRRGGARRGRRRGGPRAGRGARRGRRRGR